jgi:hypothetical protein
VYGKASLPMSSSKFEGRGLEVGSLGHRHTIKEYRRPAVRKDFYLNGKRFACKWQKIPSIHETICILSFKYKESLKRSL